MKKTSGFWISVVEWVGDFLEQDVKSEPLRARGYGREDWLCCASGKAGRCVRHSIGYIIQCKICLMAGRG